MADIGPIILLLEKVAQSLVQLIDDLSKTVSASVLTRLEDCGQDAITC